MDMRCMKCNGTISGTVSEVIAWDKTHDDHCPALQPDPKEDTDRRQDDMMEDVS
jgi:hypothetical protein